MFNIKATLRKDETTTTVDFPCDDYSIDAALVVLGETDMTKTYQFCSNISDDIKELSVLKDRFIDIEELNFLAKRIDSFDRRERLQFKAAMMVTNPVDLKDMINLTYNLHNYTLITDFSDMEKVGRTHRINVEMAIPVESDDSYDYRSLGESLASSGTGITTPYGVLFVNGLPTYDSYDGRNFPEYNYDATLMTAGIAYSDREECLYLPCTKSAVERALHRLGTESIDECRTIELGDSRIETDWISDICPDYTASDIYAINDLCAVLTDTGTDIISKLVSVCEYADIHDLAKAVLIAENIDSFEFAPDAHDAEPLGEYLIKESGHYAYDDELDNYYDYESLGEDTIENQNGKFDYHGYVGIKDGITLNEILGDEGDMKMGGM